MRNLWSESGGGRQTWFPGVVLAMLASASAAWCQASSPATLPALSAAQVVQHLMEKNKDRAAGLLHYSAIRNYRLEYHGFPASAEATMVVDVDYDAPGRKRFTIVSTTGSKLIESRVFSQLLESEQQAGDGSNRGRTELGPDNYLFTLNGVEGTNYVLSVEPRVENRFLYRGKIWVDGRDFAVTRIEAQPARNPSFWTTKSAIHHTYQKVEGGFYLPRENRTISSVRLGGTATLTIEYEAYRVTIAPHLPAAKTAVNSGDGAVWPDGGLNMALANFASAKK